MIHVRKPVSRVPGTQAKAVDRLSNYWAPGSLVSLATQFTGHIWEAVKTVGKVRWVMRGVGGRGPAQRGQELGSLSPLMTYDGDIDVAGVHGPSPTGEG